MQWLLLVLGTVLVVEAFLYLPIARSGSSFLEIITRVRHVLVSDRISDHWKERVLPTYACKLLGRSLQLSALVVLGLAPMLLLIAVSQVMATGFARFMLSPLAIAASTALALVYAMLRRKLQRV